MVGFKSYKLLYLVPVLSIFVTSISDNLTIQLTSIGLAILAILISIPFRFSAGKSGLLMRSNKITVKQFEVHNTFNSLVKKGKTKKWQLIYKDERKVIFETNVSFKSFGEIVTIEIVKMDNENSEILITSHPKILSTKFDYNVNQFNIDSLII
jgi:hypothetical protein